MYNMYKYMCYRYTRFVLWIKYYIISLTLQSTVAAAVIVASCTSLSDADGDKREKRYFRSDSIQMECMHADRIHHNGHVNAKVIYIYTYLYSLSPKHNDEECLNISCWDRYVYKYNIYKNKNIHTYTHTYIYIPICII